MAMVRCPNCGNKIDSTFYGACLDCGTLLPTPPEPALGDSLQEAPSSVEDHIARYEQNAGPTGSTPTPSPGPGRRVGVGLLARLVIVGVILFGGAAWGFLFNADRDDSGAIVDAGTLTPDQLRVGDCLDWPGSDSAEIETFESVKARPCSESHDLEVYHLATYPAVDGVVFPGDDPIIEYGIDACYEAFDAYIGLPYEEVPDIDFTMFWPTEESWGAGDRTIHCLMVHIDEGVKLTGSLRGRDT